MPSGSLGKKIPNLVVTFDNEFGYEFRVQQEVKIPLKDGPAISQALAARDAKGLRVAKKIALANVDRRASDGFKRLMKAAFNENIRKLKGPKK